MTDRATPAEEARLHLSERAARVEERLDRAEKDIEVVRARVHDHAQTLTTLSLGQSTLAADVRAIKDALAVLSKRLEVLDDLRLDVTGLQAYVYRGSAVGAAAGGGGAVGLVAGLYAIARALGWVH